jgi:phosphatidylglycerophosphatase A
MRRFILFLSSNAGLGYAPVASGTFGTLAGILFFYLLVPLPAGLYLATWTALLFLSFWICDAAGGIYGVADDGRSVLDELGGYLVTVGLLPFTWRTALLGFIFFRLFDIFKLPPARQLDRRIKNGVGVVLDDVVAGFYGAVALRLTLYWLG